MAFVAQVQHHALQLQWQSGSLLVVLVSQHCENPMRMLAIP